ncbi:TadE family protein [Streptomyces sp. NBC_01476]|uniref:TadE family protein n=1 Tax=Streptomyces sp. NBC_01476 TaxID=2903881 RepID=UPI003FCC8DD8
MTGRRTDALHHALRRRLDAAHGDSGVGVGGVAETGATGSARARPGGDRGMTSIEFVFLTPVLFFMIFATVQFGLFFFADHVAQAAAQAGARKARAEANADPGGWAGKATSTAADYIDQLGPNLLDGRHITTVDERPLTVGVRVTADVPTVFPGLHFTVDESSRGPVECFVADNGNARATCEGGG